MSNLERRSDDALSELIESVDDGGTDCRRRLDTGWPDPLPLDVPISAPSILDAAGDGRAWLEASAPPGLARYVRAIAEGNELSPETVFAAALPVIPLAIGPNVVAVGNGQHEECLSVWTLSVEPPGSRKSAAFAAATRPLRLLDEKIRREGQERRSAWSSRRAMRDREVAGIEKKVQAHFDGKEPEPAKEVAALQERLRVLKLDDARDFDPGFPELLTSNATPEAVVERVALSRRFGAFSAEGASVLEAVAEYRDKGNDGSPAAQWCALYSGDRLDVSRKGRPAVSVPERGAVFCVALTVQPDVFAGARARPALSRRGFLTRFLKVVPSTRVVPQSMAVPTIDRDASDWWDEGIRRIMNHSPEQSCRLGCEPEAGRMLRAFECEMRGTAATPGTATALIEYACKAHGLALRLAAAYHALDGRSFANAIAPDSMALAISAARYGYAVETAIAGQGNAAVGILPRLAAKLATLGEAEVRPWNVANWSWRGLQSTQDATEALRELARRNYVRVRHDKPALGRPSTVFEIRPDLALWL